MKIKVGENILIDVSDGRNYTLHMKQDVLEKKTNKVKKQFVFEGYFANVESAMLVALKRQTFLDNVGKKIDIEEYIKEIKRVSEEHKLYMQTVAIEKKLKKKRSDKNGKLVDL